MVGKEFINSIMANEELCKRFAACKDDKEVFALAKENGWDGTEKEFIEFMLKFEKSASEISPDELRAIVGGGHVAPLPGIGGPEVSSLGSFTSTEKSSIVSHIESTKRHLKDAATLCL